MMKKRSMTGRRFTLFEGSLFLLLTLFLLLSSGCEKTVPPMRIGTNVWPGYEPLYLADALGYLDRERVSLVEFPSSSGVSRGLVNGAIDAGALTLDEVVYLLDKGIPLRVILVLDISNGGDVVLGRGELKGMADLKGRRVAVEATALGNYLLSRALKLHGLELADITIVRLAVSEHEAAFRKGTVDAVVTFDPVRTVLLNAGARELFSSSEIPGEIVDVLAVHEGYLKGEGETLRHLVAGWYKALDRLREAPQRSAEIMTHRLQLTPEEVLASYRLLTLPDREETKRLMGDGEGRSPLHETLAALRRSMLSEKFLQREIPLEGVIDPAYLNR